MSFSVEMGLEKLYNEIMIDLHCHTNNSDGSSTVQEVIKLAKRLKLSQLAITDHNTLNGAILGHQLEPDLVLIGTELSVGYKNNEELHLLGYFPNESDYKYVNFVLKQSEGRKSIAIMQMVENLNSEGYDITVNELSEFAGGTINRVHICNVLMKHGYISSVQEGFSNVVGDHCPAYVPREYVSFEEAAQAIHDDGGIAVLAHPYNYKEVTDIPALLDYVVDMVDGIECFHPSATPENSKYLCEYALAHNKIITGGSDYHGDNKPNISLNMMQVDDQYIINK